MRLGPWWGLPARRQGARRRAARPHSQETGLEPEPKALPAIAMTELSEEVEPTALANLQCIDWVRARITLPGFNDLHHCRPWRGALAVANTGLETVDLVSFEGELLERWDLLEGEPGARQIDPGRDYRRVADTKPHRRHVNHLFDVDGTLWATQLRSADAVPVSGPGSRVVFADGMPHDGRWVDGRVLFTTTNGRLVWADPRSGRIERSVSLVPLTPDLEQLGWCRGVCEDPRDPGRCFVAFSAVRRSRWREFGYWIRWGQPPVPSHIALYALESGRLCESWNVGEGSGDILFQLEPLPPERWPAAFSTRGCL